MLLLLVVGVLAGVAFAGVCLQLDGVSVMGGLRFSDLLGPPRSQVPSQIVIGGPVAPSNESALAGPAAAHAAPNVARPGPPIVVQPTATPAVVPGAVYSYPPDDHGGRGGGDSGGSHGGRPGG